MRILALAVLLAACSRPVATARKTIVEPPRPAEKEAEARVRDAPCSPYWTFLFPGIGHLCLGKTGEGATMMALGGAEIGTAAVVATQADSGAENGAFAFTLVALQDLWVYAASDVALEGQRARHLPYVPTDSSLDLVLAPFNPEVMNRTSVWLGLAGMLALGIGASLALEDDIDSGNFGQDPILFGKELDAPVGYAAGGLVAGGLFTHVAMAEEALFRGLVQSGFVRSVGETNGWLIGSAIFGLVHAPNALLLEDEQDQRNYLIYGIPVITAVGGYIGWVYRDHDYSLAPPVALHFWYDFLLTATFFAIDPKNSPLSAGVTIPF